MHFRRQLPHSIFFGLFLCVCAVTQLRAGTIPASSGPVPAADLFEVSLGLNYLNLGDAYPETQDMGGFNLSAFVNATPRLSVGGEFSGDFGESHYRYFGAVTLESERLFYLFGPRFTIWQGSHLRLFVEGLMGGVHAEIRVKHSPRLDQTVSDDAFAAALGGGLDYQITRHFSWRVVQADYAPTHLGEQWQNNFRIATALVYSFGER